MDHAQFIEEHLNKIAKVQDKVVAGLIESAIERYKRSDYLDLWYMLDSVAYEINRHQLTLKGVTAKDFAEGVGLSVSTARKRLNEDTDNIVCIKTKKPYIYKAKISDE